MVNYNRIKELCTVNNLTVQKLEKLCGFSNGYLLKDRKKDIPMNKLILIASALNVDLSEIYAPDPAPQHLIEYYKRLNTFNLLIGNAGQPNRELNMKNTESMKFVSERVKELREKRGYSQTELALKLGYKDKTSIFRIENGLSDIPRSKLSKFAEVLGVEPMYFISANHIPLDYYFSAEDMKILIEVEKAGKMDILLSYAKYLVKEETV